METFAALAGFLVNGFGAGITGLLSLLAHETAATFANALAFPVFGAALLEAIAAAALGLRLPEPTGNFFYCSFLIITLAALSACVSLAGSMR